MDAFWIILCGSLVAVNCAILGCYLVLRKMAMVGDAISHGVLPGIVIAFLFTGLRDTFTMLIGAGIVGLLTTFLIEFFHRQGNLQSDASIGVTFTTLFATGVILISVFAGEVDLDQDCVLYGEIAYIPFDTWVTEGGLDLGPRTVWVMLVVLFINVLFIYLSYKELFLTTFDPAFAIASGFSASLWHYLLMGAVSLTTVASFEAVGAILVVALMITPAASAYLLTNKLSEMLYLSAFFGVLSSVMGYGLAVWIDGSIAGAMSVCTGLIFGVSFVIYRWRLSSAKKAENVVA